MSKQFLMDLNGDNRGSFHQWLSRLNQEPRIAWYPSAGTDFRDLLYLNPRINDVFPANQPEPAAPDIFLHTDYYPWGETDFIHRRFLHNDGRTKILVKSIEELPRCELPLDEGIVHFPKGSSLSHRVFFLEVEVRSGVLDSFRARVIYVFAENCAFCAEKILPNFGNISHIIHVRFGSGFGGGNSTGIWLLHVLKRLNCEYLISDNHYVTQCGDSRAYEIYPELAAIPGEKVSFSNTRIVPSAKWSEHGDVSFDIVESSVGNHPAN